MKQPKILDDDSLQGINLIFRIQDNVDSMSRTSRKIGAYITENPDALVQFTISQLANKIGVSTSSITRFCQSLGYSGYPQFKFYATQQSNQIILDNQDIDENDSLSAIKQKLLNHYTKNIEKAIQALTPQAMNQIITLVRKAQRIYFFSHGGSSASALIGQILFMQIGIPAFSFTELSMASMAASQMQRGDIAIGISSSGNAKTAVDALRIARSNGATTVGITGFSNTHLAYYSDLLLCYSLAVEDIRLMHVSRMCETAILGVIQNWILQKGLDADGDKRLQIAKNAFMSARYI